MNNKEKFQLPKAKTELEITRKLEVTEITTLPGDGGVSFKETVGWTQVQGG